MKYPPRQNVTDYGALLTGKKDGPYPDFCDRVGDPLDLVPDAAREAANAVYVRTLSRAPRQPHVRPARAWGVPWRFFWRCRIRGRRAWRAAVVRLGALYGRGAADAGRDSRGRRDGDGLGVVADAKPYPNTHGHANAHQDAHSDAQRHIYRHPDAIRDIDLGPDEYLYAYPDADGHIHTVLNIHIDGIGNLYIHAATDANTRTRNTRVHAQCAGE